MVFFQVSPCLQQIRSHKQFFFGMALWNGILKEKIVGVFVRQGRSFDGIAAGDETPNGSRVAGY